jgi:hypothetical protein
LFDVKDFDPFVPSRGFGGYDPYPPIREKIHAARKKFKEFKEFPCSLVLKDNGNAFVHLESVNIMLGSMYGNAGFRIPVFVGDGPMPREMPKIEPAFLGGGKMIRSSGRANTTISALITLRHVGVGMRRYSTMVAKYPKLSVQETLDVAAETYPNFDLGEKHLGVIVWENAVARIPLSRELFTGPYDERWGYANGHQSVVFQGQGLIGLRGDDE